MAKRKKTDEKGDPAAALDELAAIAVEPNFQNLHEAFRIASDYGDMTMLCAWIGNSHDPHYYDEPKKTKKKTRREKPCPDRTRRTRQGSRTPRRSTKSA